MGRMMRLAGVIVLVSVVGATAGCLAIAAAAGAGATVAYVKGNSEGTVGAPPAETIEAARAVFGEMSIAETGYEAEGDGKLQLIGRTPSDDKVKITVAPRAEKTSRVWVRVGVMGDEEVSDRIFQRIADRIE